MDSVINRFGFILPWFLYTMFALQVRITQLGPGMVQQVQSVCSECRGKGETINPKLRCKTCSGQKVVDDHKILEVHVDKGMYKRIWQLLSLEIKIIFLCGEVMSLVDF